MNFNINIIRKNNIELLDCQIDLILRSLEFYSYAYQFICPRKGKISEEENLRISLVRDTYNQILKQFGEAKVNNPIKDENNIFDNKLQKIA